MNTEQLAEWLIQHLPRISRLNLNPESIRVRQVGNWGGGTSRRLEVPGFELTATHSDAWALTAVPQSMLVVGGGATGAQVASIFNAFGSKVQLFQSGPRILSSEDDDVSAAVAAAFRESGMVVREGFGRVESFDATPGGVRMNFSKDGTRDSAEAAIVVVAVGWVADTEGLNLAAAGVEVNARGFVEVDSHLRTSAPHVFAAGDITGRLMLVPQASQDGFVAATNAAGGMTETFGNQVSPIGSFTEPEYAQVGLTEAKAREAHDVVVAVMRFDETARTIIDGQTAGFCKLIADRESRAILGCHVVGERAVEIVQVVAIAIAARMKVDDLARVPYLRGHPFAHRIPRGRATQSGRRLAGVPAGGLGDTPTDPRRARASRPELT